MNLCILSTVSALSCAMFRNFTALLLRAFSAFLIVPVSDGCDNTPTNQ